MNTTDNRSLWRGLSLFWILREYARRDNDRFWDMLHKRELPEPNKTTAPPGAQQKDESQ
jgi:hypothetical protein